MVTRHNKPSAELPTIASLRALEVSRLLVYCIGQRAPGLPCHHQGTVSIDGLPAEATLLELLPRFHCTQCGSADVDLRPDWTSVPGERPGRPRGRG